MIEAPEVPHAHGHSSSWFDRALALGVIILSAASLYVALHTGAAMDKLAEENGRLVRANATPLLQFSTGNVNDLGERQISFTVGNAGTGAARVIWFEIALDGRRAGNINALIDYFPRAAELDYIATNPVANTYLPAGEKRMIVAWKRASAPESTAKWAALDRDRARLVTTACYCSILGECWTSHLRADVPKPVPACDTRGRLNFSG